MADKWRIALCMIVVLASFALSGCELPGDLSPDSSSQRGLPNDVVLDPEEIGLSDPEYEGTFAYLHIDLVGTAVGNQEWFAHTEVPLSFESSLTFGGEGYGLVSATISPQDLPASGTTTYESIYEVNGSFNPDDCSVSMEIEGEWIDGEDCTTFMGITDCEPAADLNWDWDIQFIHLLEPEFWSATSLAVDWQFTFEVKDFLLLYLPDEFTHCSLTLEEE
ncbi:MAG: hypothetical protein PVI78_07805 [Anaerolineales bacterium]|jgi:hypothetical protein